MHHIIEVKDGGANEPSNLLALCPTCHALYTRGNIPKEAINAWKTMLVSLNHAFDQETISNLLFLYVIEKQYGENFLKLESTIERVLDKQIYRSMDRKEKYKFIMEANILIITGDGVLKFSHL